VRSGGIIMTKLQEDPSRYARGFSEENFGILADDELSRRPLDPPAEVYNNIWRLHDVLFDTLRVLAE
jgi:hypothetical protein